MFVQIRPVDSSSHLNSSIRISCDSVDELVSVMRQKIAISYNVLDSSQIRLFFAGKELQSNRTIFDYGIKLDHVVHVLLPQEKTCTEVSDQKTCEHLEVSSSTSNTTDENDACEEREDDPNVACKSCSCRMCGGKNEPEKQIVCDECDNCFHLWCLPQRLEQLPPEEEDWFCPDCKNDDLEIIRKKEEEYFSKKEQRKRRHTKTITGEKNWGHGMACVGRRIAQTIGSEYFGSIPGVEVGTCFRFRFQVSEAGLHGPLVAGICGKESIGASSVVFCCCYPEDIDLGEEIYFSGSGGRCSTESGCRTGVPQTKDQLLKRSNKALASSCYAPVNETTGASAGNEWKYGKPIRVLRSGNSRGAAKRSLYLPKVGIRYDGIYKVVKYWPERNETGLIVWRFLLRRDDPIPAPWTRDGKNRCRRLNLDQVIEPTASIMPEHLSNKLLCVVCLEPVGNSTTSIKSCKHDVCTKCLVQTLASDNRCPVCRKGIIVSSEKNGKKQRR